MTKADQAQVIAGLAVLALVGGLAVARRRLPVAAQGGGGRSVRRSWLGAILVGKDHRTSTSKTVAFAWTLAVAFGLLSLVVAVWLGDEGPLQRQVDNGLQEEYLLLLGGPYAAAILAKQLATSRAATKTSGRPDGVGPSQLVNDDVGDTDLGDFQYVLFNAVALLLFLGGFVGDLQGGFPTLPALLTGLALTSAGGYAAKKLVVQTRPSVTSVLPAAAAPGEAVHVFGTNLGIGADAPSAGRPLVTVGGRQAEVTAHDVIAGNDRLTVTVPADAPVGPVVLAAVRGDGTPASGPGGGDGLPFEVRPAAATTGTTGTTRQRVTTRTSRERVAARNGA